MSAIFDLLYREYCRARLAEMRKQLLIPVPGEEVLEAHRNAGGPAGRSDGNCGRDDAATANQAPTIR
jgi:hypothetical protein